MSSNSQDFIGSIVEKASNDVSFKNELMTDPKAAIEALKGGTLNIPNGKKIVVVDQTNSDTIYINIPPSTSNMELSDEQLDMVAGGWGWPIIVAPIIYTWWKRR